MPISSPNPIFDHMLESSLRDDSNKWSNIGFGEEIRHVVSIEVLRILSGALFDMIATVGVVISGFTPFP